MIYKECANCGKEFGIKKPSEAKRPSRKCCSRSCSTTLRNMARYADIGEWKECKNCNKRFYAKYARQRKYKFCSVKCSATWHNQNELPEYISKKFSESGAYQWKGDKAGYFAKHYWIRKYHGSANECEVCAGESGSTWFEWANLSRSYIRDRADWMQMCRSCHKKFDGSRVPRKEVYA